jgi:hypothetical protein
MDSICLRGLIFNVNLLINPTLPDTVVPTLLIKGLSDHMSVFDRDTKIIETTLTCVTAIS